MGDCPRAGRAAHDAVPDATGRWRASTTAAQLADILSGRYDDEGEARRWAALVTLLDPAERLVIVFAHAGRHLVWVHPRTETEKITKVYIESGAIHPEALKLARERLGYPEGGSHA